ncbi:hypothetical protein [Neorhizobium sp. IRS_2294]|uniref:hypothetical protein n=1 Tax=unclassified Neorhizobium TaxID=2629175 RepID=UPI003D2987BA
MTKASISRAFEERLHQAQLRNFRAFVRHTDSVNAGDFADGVQAREEPAYERYARQMIEGGICWRDPHARRPS